MTRAQIEALPLNGRNFLELAKLEPGVTATVRLPDDRTFVAPLGAGLQTIPRVGATRVTVDGASITTPGTAGTLLQVSQDAVQEFQISTVNFEASAGATSNGVVNIVTRSGSNVFSGAGVLFYRDDAMAAYPGLARDPSNPNPFFRQVQGGPMGAAPSRVVCFLRGLGQQPGRRVRCNRARRVRRHLPEPVSCHQVRAH